LGHPDLIASAVCINKPTAPRCSVASMPTTWALGDYPLMARRLVPAAEVVVQHAAIADGERVLDLACGTGNAALLAAELGARVDGIDIEPELLTIAAERARAEGLSVHWHRGRVEEIDGDDGEFDAVLSVFGVMYAADSAAAASELGRVCAPGGRVVLTGWMPGSFMPAVAAVFKPYLPPPPPGSLPPSRRWGYEPALRELLGGAGLNVTDTARHALELKFDSRHDAVGFLVGSAGHVIAERRRLQAEGRWPDLLADLSVLVAEQDVSRNGDRTTLELEYLLARARPK
jgi:SAM-dependent methyltransferase